VGDREIRNAAGLARGNRVPALGANSVMNLSFARGRHGLQMDLTQTGFFADGIERYGGVCGMGGNGNVEGKYT